MEQKAEDERERFVKMVSAETVEKTPNVGSVTMEKYQSRPN
jgi:hypothetical protein